MNMAGILKCRVNLGFAQQMSWIEEQKNQPCVLRARSKLRFEGRSE